MSELAAVQLRPRPFHAGVGGAFQKIDVIFAWKAHQVFHREDQRAINQAVDHEAMFGGIDFGDARVMAFKTQAVWRDDPVQFMQRGKVDRTDRIGCQPGHVLAAHMGFIGRWHAIGRLVHARAQILVPRLRVQDCGFAFGPRHRRPAHQGRTTGGRATQEIAACGLHAFVDVAHLSPLFDHWLQIPAT